MIYENLNDDNYLLYAAKVYNNINSSGTKEFLEDLERIIYLKRIFNKYHRTSEIQHRLVLNHLIVLYNVFERDGINRILFLRLEKYLHFLKPFLIFLNSIPEIIYNINNKDIYISDIKMDEGIIKILRQIKR